MNNLILRNALVTFASFIFVITVVSAWTAPTQTAPNGNVSAPVTISASDQEKLGGLTVASLLSTGGIRAFGRVQVGSTTVACTAAVAGSLRWTGTAMEHCNGTTWVPFTGGVSTITNGTCAVGQVVQSISATGTVTCGTDVGGGTGFSGILRPLEGKEITCNLYAVGIGPRVGIGYGRVFNGVFQVRRQYTYFAYGSFDTGWINGSSLGASYGVARDQGRVTVGITGVSCSFITCWPNEFGESCLEGSGTATPWPNT